MNLYCHLTNCHAPAPLWLGIALLLACVLCVVVLVLCVMRLLYPRTVAPDEHEHEHEDAA